MRFVKYAGIVVGVLIVFVLVLIGVLSVTRGTPVKQVIAEGDRGGPPTVSDTLFPRTIELFTDTHIEPGNKVQILLNGDGTYPPLWKDIASAKKTLTVQMYYSQPGAVADTMAKYLIDRARAHVRVLLLMDAFGSQPLKGDWVDNLKKNGVEFAWLRPLRWYTLHKATQRSHVRVVVVDGRVGYTGGFGLADYWLGDGHHDEQWRESNVRFEGPTVAALQAAFASGWAEATGELITGDLFFPPISFAEGGNVNAGLMHSIPTIGSTPAERLLALSIAASRRRLYITNSYFVPNDEFCNGLIKAVHRGVDVRVLTVSSKTDVKTTWYAGRALYEKLLAGGVRIYEYQPAMMHAKTMVVDGLFSAVGSMNFDNRSLAFNNESQILTRDPGIGQQMDSIFLDDLKYSKEMKLDEFRRRPWTGKVLEWGAVKLRRLL
ncbi:MAG TPA: phospholipase D-like domain-containing protein [Gemmatimonadaceae bacterium]|jgi:cardiolipin synthase|nr:phospholipase D-like domain-containing protein [Gemmatimonadaceae bacterium]